MKISRFMTDGDCHYYRVDGWVLVLNVTRILGRRDYQVIVFEQDPTGHQVFGTPHRRYRFRKAYAGTPTLVGSTAKVVKKLRREGLRK